MILEIFVILKGLTDFSDFGIDFYGFDDFEQIFVIYMILVRILMIWMMTMAVNPRRCGRHTMIPFRRKRTP